MTVPRTVLASTLLAFAAAPAVASAAPLPASGSYDLATDGTPLLAGRAAGDDAGSVVAPAGDVNGDGVEDLLVSAPREDVSGRRDAGAVYVLFGPVDQPLSAATLGSRGFRIVGARARDLTGLSVAAVGDVNGDGLGDVAVGAPNVRPAFASDSDAPNGSGAAYVVFGKRDGGDVDLAALGAQGIALTATGADDLAGTALAAVGDVDGDGVPDLAVGSPLADAPGRPDAGAVDVVSLPRTPGTLVLGGADTRELRIVGSEGARLGLSLASLGATGLAIGAPARARGAERTGAVHVVRQLGTPGVLELGSPAADPRVLTVEGVPGTLFGVSVAAAGDVDKSGTDDLLVGAPYAGAAPRERAGSAYLVKLGTTDVDVATLPDGGGVRIDGANRGDSLGTTVAGIGDFDSDGTLDVAVTAPFASVNGRDASGAAYLLFGPGAATGPIDVSGLGARGVRVVPPEAKDELLSVTTVRGGLAFGAIGAKQSGASFTLPAPTPPAPAPVLPPDPGAQEEVAAGCRAPQDVEIVFDDSGSMSETDPDALRAKAIQLLLAKPRDVGKRFGAIEFGDTTGPLFPPQAILDPTRDDGAQQKQLDDVLDASLTADNGSTDYNLAFTAAKAEAPDADARIFLTDGEHNVGEYANGHRGGPRTYVVGLTIAKGSVSDRRLARIATETKGGYYRLQSAGGLQAVVNRIDSRLNCDIADDSFVDELDAGELAPPNDVELDADTESVDVDLSWEDDSDSVLPARIDLLDDDGAPVAALGRKTLRKVLNGGGRQFRVGALTLRGDRGATFATLRVAGVGRAASIRVQVRSVKGRARIHTQIAQSRRRR